MQLMANVFKTHLGFSLYLSNSYEDNIAWINEYAQANFSFAFSTLNLLEENNDIESFHYLLSLCKNKGIKVFVDINRESLDKYGLVNLKEMGLEALRIDDGIDISEIKILAQEFLILLNASTLTGDYIEHLLKEGVDLNHILACHNYYPKPYTGLSLDKVKEINAYLHHYHIPVISFISGEIKRLPIFEGLPTVESQRHMSPLQAALENFVIAESDYICVGDSALSADSLKQLASLNDFCIPIVADVPDELRGIRFENRPDASDYVIRASKARQQLKNMTIAGEAVERQRGDVVIANSKFLRYENELEICLRPLPQDERQNVVGKVEVESLGILDYVKFPFTFTFV